jgi:hypothetical protein
VLNHLKHLQKDGPLLRFEEWDHPPGPQTPTKMTQSGQSPLPCVESPADSHDLIAYLMLQICTYAARFLEIDQSFFLVDSLLYY